MANAPTDAIKERIDIVALVSEYLPLKRAGSNFKARCPFHEEDTPSFVVSPSRQTFHCFGCSKSGDIFTWLQEREGMSFPEALRVLAQRAGVQLTFERPERREEKERLRATLDLATTFYQRILLESVEGRAARAYLESRGLTPETITAWRLGFCPDDGTRIAEKAVERGVEQQELVGAGVLGQRDGRTFEFFRGRVLFPLADAHGSVIGLAGRVFENGDGSASAHAPADLRPKYINSPETALYLKSRVLYGLDRAKEAIRKENLAILVEGYTDVIASHQAGVTHVVATAGTALTEEHLRLLRRFTDRLALAFDPDTAGAAATRRAVDLALASGFVVSVVLLPAGEDPADIAVRDPEAWRASLTKREDVFRFLLDRALALHAAATAEGKRAITADLLPLIVHLPEAVMQGDYVQQLAAALRVEPRFLYDDVKRLVRGRGEGGLEHTPAAHQASSTGSQAPAADPQLRREERLLVLLLAEPPLIPRAGAHLPAVALTVPHARALYEALHTWYARGRAASEQTGGTGDMTKASSVGPPSLAVLRSVLSEDLRARVDAFLLAVEMEREQGNWQPRPEAQQLLQSLLTEYVRRGLQERTRRLRDADAEERTRLLQDIRAMTADLARAERVSL